MGLAASCKIHTQDTDRLKRQFGKSDVDRGSDATASVGKLHACSRDSSWTGLTEKEKGDKVPRSKVLIREMCSCSSERRSKGYKRKS